MKNLKRTEKKFGKMRGHKCGDELLGYYEARMKIYVPAYRWVLENVPQVMTMLEGLKKIAET